MQPANMESLKQAGYEIIIASGPYVRASRDNQDYVLVWTGDHWEIRG